MYEVFISHAEEDYPVVNRLSALLEDRGYATWYFERDILPGPSYLGQTQQIIGQTPAILLLVSSHSLGSHEVSAELSMAHRRGCHFLPVLVDVPQSELERRQPEWSAILGLAAAVPLDMNDLQSLATRIAQGLAALGVRPSRPPAAASAQREESELAPDVEQFRKVWASDAHQIDIWDLDKLVFRNRIIDEFLDKQNRCFVSANKGLGKTLLLTYKRHKLQEAYKQNKPHWSSSALTFVPEGKPYLDFMGDCSGLSRDHQRFLASLSHAKRCWAAALRISAISYCTPVMEVEDEVELARLPRHIQLWLRGRKIEPTLVFKEILCQSVGEVNHILDRTETFLEQKFRAVHSGLCIFIDKADQALRQLPRDAWIHAQAGLIEAAWDAMNANSHVKIFASIRQEAFSNYESDIKANLYGATATIYYTHKELRELLDKLTRCYEGRRSFQEFIRVHAVRHLAIGYCEDAIRYLERHSLGRPRDLVIMASELSRRQDEMGESVFRRVVDDVGSQVIAANVFDETRVFLDALRERPDRLRFLSLIPHNILTRDEVFSVSARFNRIDMETLLVYGRDSAELHHPFWELYNTGLLGVLDRPLGEEGDVVQRFKQPNDMIEAIPANLPESDYYLIHPSLNSLIRKQHPRGDYSISNYVLVGHQYLWHPHFVPLLQVEAALRHVSEPELHDHVRWFIEQLIGGRSSDLRPDISPLIRDSTMSWEEIVNRLEHAGYEELCFGLEELARVR